MNIYYLGPPGSYSHTVVSALYKTGHSVPCRTFSEVVEQVIADPGSHGLMGLENSISSSVHESIDLLFQHTDLSIIGEACMNISLHLIGVPGSDISKITTVYSYPQALAQCSTFIKQNGLREIESPSTTTAVREVDTLQNPEIAAIAGEGSVAGTDLQILKSGIGNVAHNLTRWAVISNQKPDLTSGNKMTLIFKVKHEPGSLVKVLQSIAEKRGNLSKIESRPVPGSTWEYSFWIDIEIPDGSAEVFEEVMRQEALEYRVVGAYPRGETFNTI